MVNDELHSPLGDPAAVADELQGIYARYIYTSSKEEIAAIVEFFAAGGEAERQEFFRYQERRAELEQELYKTIHYAPAVEECEEEATCE